MRYTQVAVQSHTALLGKFSLFFLFYTVPRMSLQTWVLLGFQVFLPPCLLQQHAWLFLQNSPASPTADILSPAIFEATCFA